MDKGAASVRQPVYENICRPLYAGVSCTLIALFVVLGWQWPLERALQVCFD